MINTKWLEQAVNVAQNMTIVLAAAFASPILTMGSYLLIYEVERLCGLRLVTPGQFVLNTHGRHELARHDVAPAAMIDFGICFFLILSAVFFLDRRLKKRKVEA